MIGKLELDKTFEERDIINAQVVQAIDEAALNWGVKVLRYEIKDLTPPKEILHAMQAQITAEREKRAVIATSEGKQQGPYPEAQFRNLIARGATNQVIADRLVITVGTVKSHINHILGKLEAHNRTEAVARARELGLLEI